MRHRSEARTVKRVTRTVKGICRAVVNLPRLPGKWWSLCLTAVDDKLSVRLLDSA